MQPLPVSDVSLEDILLRRKGLRRQLLSCDSLQDIRIAVLGGTTTNELVDMLEILLLRNGFRPIFHQSDYGRFYEDAVLEPQTISAFQPNLIYIHTCALSIRQFPSLSCTEDLFQAMIDDELNRFRSIWTSLGANVGCQMIQNNFDLPATAILGNLDAVYRGGRTHFTNELNRRFTLESAANPLLIIQDIASISARVGLDRWFDPNRWYSYKIANTVEGSFAVASSLAALVRAVYGRARKVLVLDLDNTLWGGVIGDDGADKIVLGRETPIAEAYTAFQEYCVSLRNRGVLLAVCSKNNDEIARQGFAHPDSVLKLEHFSAFKANWEPKHENILAIASELGLGADSFVFVDDNPAERALIEAQIPGVAVPNVGSDVAHFAAIIEEKRYFETLSLGKEDLARASLYKDNALRASLEAKFANYDDYLDSLEMTAEIDSFNSTYMERIVQLTNKSNQFNLTTRRYAQAEMNAAAHDGKHIGIYGKLFDRFGDNGLISVILGTIEERTLLIDLWLMSCRVLKRHVEIAMLDALVARSTAQGINSLVGYYLPTAKNGMVARHYEKLGFSLVSSDDTKGSTVWSLDITGYVPRNRHIKILELAHE